ncbi:Zip-domain-containing protein [Piedraia hortae CBS 480.64]|uniref:Zip-domain-containing protein n=1 Tax=Piedraia hortae CBS 480.64 TaxID=1314780 RepID=A0A6A7C4H0_9PEZI|nr:Zip-domain-containing protein [Piedraia hortae CBS 480.64]
MADGVLNLLVLCAVMGAASFGAGLLPLAFTLSQRHLRLLSALGAGVLLGSALVAVIPEGVETICLAPPSHHKHEHEHVQAQDHVHHHHHHHHTQGHYYGNYNAKRHIPPPGGSEGGCPSHKSVGVALLIGFVLMYLIDILPKSLLQRKSLSGSSESSGSSSISTTIGLVIHAFADGIALGAASSAPGLTLVIFLALMIHKAPASFGLTSILLKQGLPKRNARFHLAIFALASPVGAIVTNLLTSWWAGPVAQTTARRHEVEANDSSYTTGFLLLFSGGTFLYVAMHALQDSGNHDHGPGHEYTVAATDPDEEQKVTGTEEDGLTYSQEPIPLMDDAFGPSNAKPRRVSIREAPEKQSLVDAGVTVGGMLLPLVLSTIMGS